jgi:hypothetical protein
MLACPEHTNGDLGTEECLGWGDKTGDADEGAGEAGIVGGRGVEPGDVRR